VVLVAAPKPFDRSGYAWCDGEPFYGVVWELNGGLLILTVLVPICDNIKSYKYLSLFVTMGYNTGLGLDPKYSRAHHVGGTQSCYAFSCTSATR
jgi:hypothetical protein